MRRATLTTIAAAVALAGCGGTASHKSNKVAATTPTTSTAPVPAKKVDSAHKAPVRHKVVHHKPASTVTHSSSSATPAAPATPAPSPSGGAAATPAVPATPATPATPSPSGSQSGSSSGGSQSGGASLSQQGY